MKTNQILSCIVVAALCFSCSDQLDLDPFQSIPTDDALSSDENVKAVLIGAYDELGNGDLFGGNNLRDAELLGGDGEILWTGTFQGPREIANKRISIGNLDAEETWLESYETINIVNNVLSALDVVNEGDRDRVSGEAKFIRALTYFDLVRFYGPTYEGGQTNDQPGVPLVLTPTGAITDADNVARASVEEVYAQIINDLTDAAEELIDDPDDPMFNENAPFATAGAARALLARAYLQMDRYADALTQADTVIASGEYQLVGEYEDAFMNESNSSEDIFAIQVNTQDGVNNMTVFFSVPDFGGRDGDIEVLDSHYELYEEGDQRLDLFFDGVFTGKYNDQFANVGIIRLAEMYLIRAEANARLGSTVGAAPVEDINLLRSRVGLEDLDAVDVDFILEERRRELAFEGFRIHDIKRTQGSTGTFEYDAPELVYPIPQREIVANPNLVQNPGY